MRYPRTWVVVVDAQMARIFERTTATGHVVEKPELTLRAPPRPAQRDRAPRTQESASPARHRIEARTAPRLAHEKAFLEVVAEQLDRDAARDAFDQLIISAPARAAGLLKSQLSKAVQAKLKQVWTKDLVHESAANIEKRLTAN